MTIAHCQSDRIGWPRRQRNLKSNCRQDFVRLFLRDRRERGFFRLVTHPKSQRISASNHD